MRSIFSSHSFKEMSDTASTWEQGAACLHFQAIGELSGTAFRKSPLDNMQPCVQVQLQKGGQMTVRLEAAPDARQGIQIPDCPAYIRTYGQPTGSIGALYGGCLVYKPAKSADSCQLSESARYNLAGWRRYNKTGSFVHVHARLWVCTAIICNVCAWNVKMNGKKGEKTRGGIGAHVGWISHFCLKKKKKKRFEVLKAWWKPGREQRGTVGHTGPPWASLSNDKQWIRGHLPSNAHKL